MSQRKQNKKKKKRKEKGNMSNRVIDDVMYGEILVKKPPFKILSKPIVLEVLHYY